MHIQYRKAKPQEISCLAYAVDAKDVSNLRGFTFSKQRSLPNLLKEVSCTMKRALTVISLFVFIFSAPFEGNAAEPNLRSGSYVRILRDRNLLSSNETWVPFYEYLSADVFDLAVHGLSIHFSGWGRGDITSKGDGRRGDGELIYGYLEWRPKKFNFDLQAGRQFITSGPASMRGQYADGINIKSDLVWGIGIEVLAGSPVRSETGGRSGDIIAQGRLFRRWGKSAEAGISYVNIRDNGEPGQENLGFDLWLKPVPSVDGSFYAYYDTLSENFADLGIDVNYSPTKVPWRFSAGYNYITPADLLSHASIFFVFSNTALGDASFNATFLASRYVTLDIGGDWYHYSNNTDAGRFGADVTMRYGRLGRNTVGFGLHRLTSLVSGITEARLYNRHKIVRRLSVSGDLYGYLYDRSIRGRTFSFTSVAALNLELPKGFVLTGSGDFSTSPYFNADFKGMLKLTYNFGGSSSAF